MPTWTYNYGYKFEQPEQYAAVKAVYDEVYRGRMLPPKAHKCHGCNRQAIDHHHASYKEQDRLCVVPLCRSCHTRIHRGTLVLTFGIVPTAVGLIRIAIAGMP